MRGVVGPHPAPGLPGAWERQEARVAATRARVDERADAWRPALTELLRIAAEEDGRRE